MAETSLVKRILKHTYISVKNSDLVHYRVTPDSSLDNQTPVLARAFHEFYCSTLSRVQISPKRANIELLVKDKGFFDMILTPGDAAFYYSCMHRWGAFLENKLHSVFPRCAIQKVGKDEINGFEPIICDICDIRLSKHNMFSLKTTTKDLDPLNSMFAVLKDLDASKKEKIRVSIVVDPIDRLDWNKAAEEAYKLYQRGKMPKRIGVSRDDIINNGAKVLELGAELFIQAKLFVIDGIMGILGEGESEEDKIERILNGQEERRTKELEVLKQIAKGGLSQETYYKMRAPAFHAYIRIISQGIDESKRKGNMRLVANSFKDLSLDNELYTVELPKKKQRKRFQQVLGFDISEQLQEDVLCDAEVAKLIQLPQITLQSEYRINSIESREEEVPQELREGGIPIGTAQYRGKQVKVFWPKNVNARALPKIWLAGQGAGKTSALVNFAVAANSERESVIHLDYIQECEASKAIERHIRKKDLIVIDLSDTSKVFSMSYPEVSQMIRDTTSSKQKRRLASLLAGQIEILLNSVKTGNTDELSGPMLRYLYAACMVAFTQPGSTLDDVFDILRNPRKRHSMIEQAIQNGIFEKNEEIILDLEELDDYMKEKGGNIVLSGNRDSLVIGIINRAAQIKRNEDVAAMLSASMDYTQNFIDYMEQGKTVLVRIPQTVFPSMKIRDLLVTYFVGRIWLSAQIRQQRPDQRLSYVLVDEVHQIPGCANYLKDYITEFRRHRLSFLFAIHFLKQFKDLLDAIKNAGSSFLILAGCGKDNIQMLKEEIAPFTVEDALKLKAFHSLNIINYGNEYAKFITQLPPPLP